MNNPNPFVPQGSLLEQQSKRRSRLKIGVFCALAIGICGLAAMLIQGCKREESDNNMGGDQGQPPVDTNVVAETDSNQPPMEASNPPVATAPPESAQQGPPPAPAPAPEPAPAPAPAPTENEYVVVRGDSFWKIAKANGVTVRAIKDANPGVDPAKLKVGEKIVIPAGAGGSPAPGTEGAAPADNGGEEVYTIKSGDTLSRIAKHLGVTVKAIEEANNLSSTKIYVGKKLTIPVAAPAPAPEAAPAPAPAPEPAPAPAPANPPPAQQNPPANQ